ncbi:MAG: hypothetical protein P4M07_13005 [Xanthobacteraceae bacterium]|nr:hypothetical protein [Xanthobacteraceae bacterium]
MAVELALLLNLDLLGLFVEDSGLRDLAGNPFAREFRPLNGGWHALDIDRLSSDLELAARGAARLFADAVRRLSTRSRFEVVRGPTAQTISALSQGGDIMLVVEPTGVAERIAQQLSWSADAAFRSVAAVMLVPRRVARNVGPVIAIAASPLDPSIDAAAGIAAAAKEQLVVVRLHDGTIDDARLDAIAAESGLAIRQIAAARGAQSDAAALAALLGGLQERLIVVTRNKVDREVVAALAATRHIPVLVIGPAESETQPA